MGQRLFDESISIGQVFYMIAYEGWRPPIPDGCPSDSAQLMTDCWAEDPEQRPPASVVLARLNKMYAVEKQHLIQERQEHEAAQQQMLEGVQEQAAGSSPRMSPQQGGRMMQGPPVGALVRGDEVRMEQVGHPAAARGANGQLAAAAGAQPGYQGRGGSSTRGAFPLYPVPCGQCQVNWGQAVPDVINESQTNIGDCQELLPRRLFNALVLAFCCCCCSCPCCCCRTPGAIGIAAIPPMIEC